MREVVLFMVEVRDFSKNGLLSLRVESLMQEVKLVWCRSSFAITPISSSLDLGTILCYLYTSSSNVATLRAMG